MTVYKTRLPKQGNLASVQEYVMPAQTGLNLNHVKPVQKHVMPAHRNFMPLLLTRLANKKKAAIFPSVIKNVSVVIPL